MALIAPVLFEDLRNGQAGFSDGEGGARNFASQARRSPDGVGFLDDFGVHARRLA